MLPARGVLEAQTMKLWHKILWITTAIVPFAVIALAWQYAESSFFFLLQRKWCHSMEQYINQAFMI